MSPRRGDRVTVPPPQDQWDVRFGTEQELIEAFGIDQVAVARGDPFGPFRLDKRAAH